MKTIKNLCVDSKGRNEETIIKRGATANLPTKYGNFKITPFIRLSDNSEHIALIKGEWSINDAVLVRLHSSCATGDLFGSFRCDCGSQLHESMRIIEKEGKGIIIYLDQEGRGIGLFNKIHAYQLQDEGLDTIEANIALGFEPDEREYEVAALILKEQGIERIRLITNNLEKSNAMKGLGLQVIEMVPIEITPNQHNEFYLKTKKDKMGHLLQLSDSINV